MAKPDMSCARVHQYQSSNIGSAERHNERKNESYDNINVEISRIPFNIHYKDTGGLSYMDMLRKLEADGKISLRGLRQDATLFDEIIIDVNTMYFEKNGGYDYAKRFYEEAYRFIEKKFGSEYVISAVMHADEINRAASDDLNKVKQLFTAKEERERQEKSARDTTRKQEYKSSKSRDDWSR